MIQIKKINLSDNMIETKLDGKTKDIVSENISKMKNLFPEVFQEDTIDFDKLKQLLNGGGGKYGVNADDERYNFTWKGKTESIQIAQTPSTGTLRPCKEESKNWDTTQNLYIEGDNLEVLKLLQKTYSGKIKMIYIDPPYNTGKDFVYKDNYRDNLENYIEQDENGFKTSSNQETSGRYHTNWLNMMYPRLKLARNLLKEDGVIFISIDDNEVENLKKICNEIFGEENFITTIVWRKKTGSSDSKDISTITEYVLVYVKSKHNLGNIFTKNENSYDPKRYKLKDEYYNRRGSYYIDTLDRGGISYSDSMNYPITCPDGTITYPNGRTQFKNDGWIWTWGKEKLEWGLKKGFIVFKKTKNKKSGWGVYYKNYVHVNNKDELKKRAAPHKNLIVDIINTEGSKEIKELFDKKVFKYTKPSKYIKKLCSFVNNKDVILDFFSGSASTAEAIMKLNVENKTNNRFIMVQLPEQTDEKSEAYKAGFSNICEIGKERIRRAGDKIIEETGNSDLDIGFKVFKLDSSNIMKWNPDYNNLKNNLLAQTDNIVEGRSELDLVYEIMLKYGIDITLPIDEYETDGYKLYSVGAGALIICLDDMITKDVANSIVDLKNELNPFVSRVVLKDSGFVSDADKVNVREILKNNEVEEFITI